MLLYNMPKPSIQKKLRAYDADALPAIRAHFSAAVEDAINKPKTKFERIMDSAINAIQGSIRDYFNPAARHQLLSLAKPDEENVWEFAGWHIRNTPGIDGNTFREAINKTMQERNITADALGLTAKETHSLTIHQSVDIPYFPPS